MHRRLGLRSLARVCAVLTHLALVRTVLARLRVYSTHRRLRTLAQPCSHSEWQPGHFIPDKYWKHLPYLPSHHRPRLPSTPARKQRLHGALQRYVQVAVAACLA